MYGEGQVAGMIEVLFGIGGMIGGIINEEALY